MARAVVSKDEFVRDIKIVLYVLIYELRSRIYWGGGELCLVDFKSNSITRKFDSTNDEDMQGFDISGMEVTRYMLWIYDYVVDGRLEKRLEDDWINIDEDIAAFFRGLVDFPLIENNADYFPLDSILHVLDLADARRKLDYGCFVSAEGDKYDWIHGHMLLRDVALLAGIDEKTARNLANPKAKNRLATINWEGRTIIENKVAEEWLKNRGYKPTVIHDSELERDLSKIGFWSIKSLSDYVRGHRDKLGMDLKQLATRAGLCPDGFEWLKQLDEGNCTFDKERLVLLAKALGVDTKSFVIAALKIIQETQQHLVESELIESQ